MINHGIITGALFILLGFLYTRRHTYEISELKGLAKVAPWFAGAFTLVMLASIGVPGLSGFVGEFLVLIGTFLSHRWWAVVAATGVILAALYLLWAYQRVFHGEPDEANRSFPDLKTAERPGDAPAHRADRVPRRVPQAGPRPDRAVGQGADRPGRDRGADLPRAQAAGPDRVGQPRRRRPATRTGLSGARPVAPAVGATTAIR